MSVCACLRHSGTGGMEYSGGTVSDSGSPTQLRAPSTLFDSVVFSLGAKAPPPGGRSSERVDGAKLTNLMM